MPCFQVNKSCHNLVAGTFILVERGFISSDRVSTQFLHARTGFALPGIFTRQGLHFLQIISPQKRQ
eukprot:m.339899 g.339899  ORF g.339899 m.339899 type:complete len:66 (+) comp19026_c0_seq1:88-285(+)